MRRAIATVSMSGTLREKLEAIAAARFDGIELFEPDFIQFNGSAREVGALAADLGLGIDLYQPFRDFEAVPDAVLRRNLERAERKFDVMNAMGASLMLVCSSVSPQVMDEAELAAAQLYELAERAKRRGIRIGYEALAWGKFVNRWSQAWAIVKRANHPHLGLIVDSFHSLSLNDDPSGIAELPGEKIFFMQLADAPRLAMDVIQWARHYRCFPGQGQFDLENFLEQVLVAGYTGPISLEVFNDLFREAPNRRTAVDAMRSLLFLEGQVRSKLERSKERARTLERIELYDPPAAPAVSGLSFLEFAVDEGSGRALGALLEKLGFSRAGRHRSKDVTLYRQGAVNLILNAQPNSLARTHFMEHGPSICAVGLQTEDPVRALNRATALHCARFDSPIGPDELKIPAIRAPDGSVLYWVSGLYETDFVLAPKEAGGGAGLEYIDHIALGMPEDELDTWMLFCRAVLGLQPGESLELSDPYGLIRSRGLASENRRLRIVLNVSLSQRTLTARTVSASGGASVHHIALGCRDIFGTVGKLRASGVEFVPISQNYYDDLPTRFDLEPGLAERLRSLGILYDRSPGGEYFHVYGASFAGRFFFEIIQRGRGYDAYGALNAPARMASQAQA